MRHLGCKKVLGSYFLALWHNKQCVR
jgi:hypothetical protein